MKNKQHQIFISYAVQDKSIARTIANELEKKQISVWLDENEINFGNSITEKIETAISTSDYILVILSANSVNSLYMKHEFDKIQKLAKRDITILPILVADCNISYPFNSYQYFDLRDNFASNISQLIEQLSLTNLINFSKLDGKSFETLIMDLLSQLDFKNVTWNPYNLGDLGFDLQAVSSYFDPLGVEIEETWLIEIKFYQENRFSLESIQQLANCILAYSHPVKGLLITNSHLTSVAEQWLLSFQENHKISVRVVDGTELKRLLLHHPDLIKKYFSSQPSVLI